MACGPVRARRAQVFCARHPPGGPSCARPLRRGWRRVRAWPRLRPVAAPPIARGLARTGGAARTTPSAASGLHRVHGPSCGPFGRPVLAARPRLGPRPWPDRRQRRAAPQASKQGSKGGLVPPWTPQPSAYGARQRARRPGPTRGFRSQPHAGAGVRPAAHRWHHGRRLVLRAVRSSGSGSAVGASARAPRSGVGVNPARFAPRRCAAGCAGGLTPPPDRGSGWWSPRRAVRPAPFPTGAGRGSRSAHAITGNSYASPGRRGLDAGPRSAPSGRLRDSGDRSPRGSTASKQGGRAAPLGPPARMARAGQAATEWSHTGAIAPRPCRACQPGGAGSRHESGRRGQPLPAPCVTLR